MISEEYYKKETKHIKAMIRAKQNLLQTLWVDYKLNTAKW